MGAYVFAVHFPVSDTANDTAILQPGRAYFYSAYFICMAAGVVDTVISSLCVAEAIGLVSVQKIDLAAVLQLSMSPVKLSVFY